MNGRIMNCAPGGARLANKVFPVPRLIPRRGNPEGTACGGDRTGQILLSRAICVNQYTSMVRISKKQPTEKVLAIMNEQFIKHIARIGIPKEAEHFFHEMFTQAEQTMYMKRFAILVMLERGYSFSVIRRSLRVSQTTISRVQNARNKNLFDRTALHIGRRLKRHTRMMTVTSSVFLMCCYVRVATTRKGKMEICMGHDGAR